MMIMMIRGKEGVTLIEIMIVVVIVGILASIAIPAYNDYVTRSRRSDAFTALETVRAAQEMNRAEKGVYVDAAGFAANLLAGCSSTMAGNNYTIENLVVGNNPPTFRIEATAKNKQTGDHSFRINQNGDQEYLDGGIWKSDPKWEDLR